MAGVKVPLFAFTLIVFYVFMLIAPTEYWADRIDRYEARMNSTLVSGDKMVVAVLAGAPFIPAFVAGLLAAVLGSKASFLSAGVRLPLTAAQLFLVMWVVLQCTWPVARYMREAGPMQSPGWMALLNLQLVLLPVSRTSPLLTYMKVDPAVTLTYHKWLGWFTIIFGLHHGAYFQLIWLRNFGFDEWLHRMTDWNGYKPRIAGAAAWFTLIFILATSLEHVRRNYYRVFYLSHKVGTFVFLICFTAHFPPAIWWMSANLLIYMADRFTELRAWFSPIPILSARFNAGILSIRIPSSEPAQPMQWVMIQGGGLSQTEQHPFSVAVADQDSFTLCIKVVRGGWTDRLREDVINCGAARLRVTDFYGASYVDEDYTKPLLMIAGGSGITPFTAMLQRFARFGKNNNNPMDLVWVVRTEEEANEFMHNLNMAGILAKCPSLQVIIHTTDPHPAKVTEPREVTYQETKLNRPPRPLVELLTNTLVPLGALGLTTWVLGGLPMMGTDWWGYEQLGIFLLGGAIGGMLALALAQVLGGVLSCGSGSEDVELGQALTHDAKEQGGESDGPGIKWLKGIPEMTEIFKDVEKRCVDKNTIKCLASGPGGLVDAARRTSGRRSIEFEEFSFVM